MLPEAVTRKSRQPPSLNDGEYAHHANSYTMSARHVFSVLPRTPRAVSQLNTDTILTGGQSQCWVHVLCELCGVAVMTGPQGTVMIVTVGGLAHYT